MSNEAFLGLRNEDVEIVLNNCFANIFVTDGKGKIVFINQDSADSLCTSIDELMNMTCTDLLEKGIIDYSTTLEAIKKRERCVGTFTNLSGNQVVAVTTPIFDDDGTIKMCVTYSRIEDDLGFFLSALKKEREDKQHFKELAQYYNSSKTRSNDLIFQSKEMKRVQNLAKSIASTDTTVMIYGESGTGKEVLANYIHKHSACREESFVPVNCAAIPTELLESEFFGYEKGAFTGANSKGKAGLFEIAQNGTLFLDEIGDLPLAMQSKLLRCLESGEFRRVGGGATLHTNARIIGATHRNLEEMTRSNEFREDLYYRLNVLPIRVPALRDRRTDIDVLVDYFLNQMNRKHNRNIAIDRELRTILKEYDWPGNIRELKNIIERFVVTRDRYTIEALQMYNPRNRKHVAEELQKKQKTDEYFLTDKAYADISIPLKDKMNEIESEYIQKIIHLEGGNKERTAELIGISRAQLYRKISAEKSR